MMIALIILTAICNQNTMAQSQAKKRFTIKGITENNLNNNIIYLIKNNGNKIDSCKIVNNKFYLKGFLEEPELMSIKIEEINAESQIFVEESVIDLKINNKKEFLVKGSKIHDKWNLYNEELIVPIKNKLIELSKKRSVALQAGDSLLYKNLKTQNDSVSIVFFSERQNLVEKKPYDFFNLYLLTEPSYDDAYIANTLVKFKKYLSFYPTYKKLEKEYITKKLETLNKKLENYNLPDINGVDQHILSNSSYTLIDFWASWCGPCIKQIPAINDLHNKYQNENLKIVSIAVNDEHENWKRAIKNNAMTNLQLRAPVNHKILSDLNVNSLPKFVLIDKYGKIIRIESNVEIMKKNIYKILNK